MAPKIAFLLCAGFGTRMGNYASSLPKPLWPIFEKSQLDFHIWNLFDLGVEKVYVNTHYMAEKIETRVSRDFSAHVEFLREPSLLGSGGCFHNLLKQKGLDQIIYAQNVDIFFSLLDDDLTWAENELKRGSDTPAYLYSIPVGERDDYNRLVVEGGCLRDIVSPPSRDHLQTYSGCGLINLEELKYHEGRSDFFRTVADYRQHTVKIELKDIEYWDFGTLENYLASHWKLLENTESNLFKKLVRAGAIEEEKVLGVSYGAPEKLRVINLSSLSPRQVERLGIRDALIMPGTREQDLREGVCEKSDMGRLFYPRVGE